MSHPIGEVERRKQKPAGTMTFEHFFTTATGGNQPYDYQRRLAEESACQSRLIEIPTGLGKTAAVVLAWLWNRVHLQQQRWPRRLVYCLPMRTLVEQTETNVRDWLEALGKENPEIAKVGVHVLMGGEDSGEWDIHPEREAILIGTQDMLLSRALNRGYGMSRYRWPMHFGLLNNDALWVMDEVQLMGVGVETSAQLDGFRHDREMSVVSACPSWWMSATLDKARLVTVDHPEPAGGWKRITLSDAEPGSGSVQRRYAAAKPIKKAALALTPANKTDYGRQLAALIREKHQAGTLTLVVVNRVQRAQQIYAALRDKKLKLDPARVALIHSRFRPEDRARHEKLLFGEGDRIAIATQAVEAGVDVSARLLITELAPWSSLVQRFGRCNRAGQQDDAEILWIDVQPKDEKDELALPYEVPALDAARKAVAAITDAGPRSLELVSVPETVVIRPVLRRKDLLDLFDTTPDVCGNDLDISRYIRDGEENDVQLFWRAVPETGPAADTPAALRRELCRVSIGEFDRFLKAKVKPRALVWNALEDAWQEANRARPGGMYLVAVENGGYSEDLGWTRDADDQPAPLPPESGEAREGISCDPQSFRRVWLSLARHTKDVIAEMSAIAGALPLTLEEIAALESAAQWHDVGKAHEYFQRWMAGGDPARAGDVWAKSAHDRKPPRDRRGFRHELASALAWLLTSPPDAVERDLVAYLIASHHGKVRLSIRALPNEKLPDGPTDRLHARGIWDKDPLPRIALPTSGSDMLLLDLSLMKMGDGPLGPSWLARTTALRERLGPFRLAYLETLLRAADMRASAAEAANTQP